MSLKLKMDSGKKILYKFLPGGLRGNAEATSLSQTIWLIVTTALAYRRTFWWYLKSLNFHDLYTFLYTKTMVPVGEGAGAALYFALGPILRKFPQLAPYPKYIEVEITTICSKKCILCEHTYWRENEQEKRHLTLEEFSRITSQFPRLKWVNLTGEGDAFSNPDYLKMISKMRHAHVQVFLVDSFSGISQDTAEFLVDNGVAGIYVSLDGATKDTYENIKIGCNFDIINRNLKYLVQYKKNKGIPIPELCFRFVIINKNIDEMPLLPYTVSKIGNRKELGDGSRIEYCGLLEFDNIKQYKVEHISKELIEKSIRASEKVGIPVFFAHSEDSINPPLEHCLAWLEPYFMMGGYVMPCCSVMMSNKRPELRKMALGNIYNDDFNSIWNSERYKKLRKTINDPNAKVPKLCLGCRAYDTSIRAKKFGVDYDL